MLDFPFYFLKSFIFLFVLVIISVSIFAYIIYKWINLTQKGEKNVPVLAILTIVTPILLYASHCSTRLIVTETHLFRSIPISKVNGIKMSYKDAEYNNTRIKPSFDDPVSIQEALSTLKNCEASSNNQVDNRDSYTIRLIFDDESFDKDFYISVYQKSDRDDGELIFSPHLTENNERALGKYKCPEFQEWIKKNIDPLFQNEKDLVEGQVFVN